jgi:hypothetical protein
MHCGVLEQAVLQHKVGLEICTRRGDSVDCYAMIKRDALRRGAGRAAAQGD